MSSTGLFAIGDSKTQDDDWVALLVAGLEATAQTHYTEVLPRYGLSGYTAATMNTYMQANLSAVTGTPSIVTVNLGSNDAVSLPAEATWKANMIGIIDQVRAKWPAADIYIARPWRISEDADCDTLATWIADIVSGYASGVHLGPDERVWFENGDNGATYSADGIHYNAAGEPVCAAAWLAAITA